MSQSRSNNDYRRGMSSNVAARRNKPATCLRPIRFASHSRYSIAILRDTRGLRDPAHCGLREIDFESRRRRICSPKNVGSRSSEPTCSAKYLPRRRKVNPRRCPRVRLRNQVRCRSANRTKPADVESPLEGFVAPLTSPPQAVGTNYLHGRSTLMALFRGQTHSRSNLPEVRR
jgi:hypothetical protein